VPARQWFDALDAPSKTWVELPDAGHVPNFEQPALFADVMHQLGGLDGHPPLPTGSARSLASMTALEMRPRSFTLCPFARAHSRIAAVSSRLERAGFSATAVCR
jgi:hypothetical protein